MRSYFAALSCMTSGACRRRRDHLHAFRSGSRYVEMSISFDLTLESVPAFRLPWLRRPHAFGTIGSPQRRKHGHVAALRASWTLASAPAHGRKLPRVSSDISAEGGTDSTGSDDWFFARGIEDHSGRARQGRCTRNLVSLRAEMKRLSREWDKRLRRTKPGQAARLLESVPPRVGGKVVSSASTLRKKK